MELRFLKGSWGFGKFKLQFREGPQHPQGVHWIDVPTEDHIVDVNKMVKPKESPVEEKKEWCEHLILNVSYTGGIGVPGGYAEAAPIKLHALEKKWLFCPVCGTPRPKPRDIRSELAEKFDSVKDTDPHYWLTLADIAINFLKSRKDEL